MEGEYATSKYFDGANVGSEVSCDWLAAWVKVCRNFPGRWKESESVHGRSLAACRISLAKRYGYIFTKC